jgi:hypothetical protein
MADGIFEADGVFEAKKAGPVAFSTPFAHNKFLRSYSI